MSRQENIHFITSWLKLAAGEKRRGDFIKDPIFGATIIVLFISLLAGGCAQVPSEHGAMLPTAANGEDLADKVLACNDHVLRVNSYVLDPRDKGNSKQDVLKAVRGSDENPREKSILGEITRITFDEKADWMGLVRWSMFNCVNGTPTAADFVYPWNQYGSRVKVCSTIGRVARGAMAERNEGRTRERFIASHMDKFKDPKESEQAKALLETGASYAFDGKASRDPVQVRSDTFDDCFKKMLHLQ